MRFLLPVLPALLLSLPAPAVAQSIIPAADGTGTLVLPDGTTYTITGGTLSGDGANLFHSFEQFGLTATEVATFLADPAVQNILGRVVGGNASVIDGLMQANSGANLYLINPAGILFGPNSVLNLEGSFTATSASGLAFGENWLQAIGDSNYGALTGDPTAFSFSDNAGAIINSGNLAVGTGERLTLMGGSVVNLGTLNAPGGQIVVLAVPGENLITLRPVGSILGLELATLPAGAPGTAPLPFSPLDIPGLLRAGEPEVATGMTINADGTVSLVGSTTPLPTATGTAIASGNIDVSGTNVSGTNVSVTTGGTVQVLGDRVAVVGATLDASGPQGGGTVLIGGDYQGENTVPAANRTYVDANSTITANAGASGNGGEVILWAEEATGFEGTITAQGGAAAGDGGLVEVSGRENLVFNGLVDVSAANGAMGTLLLDPTNITISLTPPSSPGVDAALPNILLTNPDPLLAGDITINSTVLQNQTGNIVLQATNDIFVDDGITLTFVPGGAITFTADADGDGFGSFIMDQTQSIIAQGNAATNGRDITISGANVVVGNINTDIPGAFAATTTATNGGNITLTSTDGVISTGNLNTSVCNGFFCTGNAGSVTLTTTFNGFYLPTVGMTTGAIDTSGSEGSGGDVALSLTASGDINTGTINTLSRATLPGTRAGNVTLSTPTGDLVLGRIDSSATGDGGGNISLTTGLGAITVTDLVSRSINGTSGTINLQGNTGLIQATGLIDAGAGATGTPNVVTLGNNDGPITVVGDILASTVDAVSTGAFPLRFGNINATDLIRLTNQGDVITTGNLTTTGNLANITVNNGAGGSFGLVNLANVTAGGSIFLSSMAPGNPIITTGNLTANTSIAVSSGVGGTVTTNGTVSVNAATPGVGALLFSADEVNFLGGAGTVQALGAGLSISPADPTLQILLGGTGDTGPTVLDLDQVDLAALANGFSDITIGGGAGFISLAGDVVFRDPLTLFTLGAISTPSQTLTGVDDASLTLQAGTGVGTGPIRTAGTPVTLIGDGDNNGAGEVAINGAITTNGGAITLRGASVEGSGVNINNTGSLDSGGGAIAINGTALGDPGSAREGVLLNGAINSQGGNIQITGTSNAQAGVISFSSGSINAGPGGNITIVGNSTGTDVELARGIELQGPLSTGGGTLTINGTSSGASGVVIAPTATVNSGGGAIAINGVSTGGDPIFSQGVALNSPVNSGGGAITLNGTSSVTNGVGIYAEINSGTGNVIITTDNPLITAPVLGSGTLTIQPNTPALPITLGGFGDATLTFLNQGEIANLGDGFSLRTIGQAGSTGPLTLDTFTLASPLTVNGGIVTGPNQATTWAIEPDGSLLVSGFGAPLRLNPTTVIGGNATNTVLGSPGNDTVGPSSGFTLQLGSILFTNITNFDGQGGIDTLLGTASDDQVTDAGLNSARLNGGLRFDNIEIFDGSAGFNTLAGSGLTNTVSTLGPGTLLLNGIEYRNINVFNGALGFYTLLGTSGNDVLALVPTAGASSSALLNAVQFDQIVAFDGGAGIDTILGNSANNIFEITGSNSGIADRLSVTNIEALNTGSGQDTLGLTSFSLLDLPVTSTGSLLSIISSSASGLGLNANITTTGDLEIIAANAMTQTGGQLVVGGNTQLVANGPITLAGPNDFTTVTISQGQTTQINDINDLQLNPLTVVGGLQATAAGNLTTGAITSNNAPITLQAGGNLTTTDIRADGGPITLQSGGRLTAGNLDSQGDTGGTINLRAGDRLQVNTINAQGTTQGGTIKAVTPLTFQALGTFLDQRGTAASLSTVGSRGGPITLAYGVRTFTIGDPSQNGSRGAITSGDILLAPGIDPIIGTRTFGQRLPGVVRFISQGDVPLEIEDPPTETLVESSGEILSGRPDEVSREAGTVLLSSTGQTLTAEGFSQIEATLNNEFSGHFGNDIKPPRPVTLAQAQATLRDIQTQTGETPALVYVRFNRTVTNEKAGQGALELLMITAEGEPSQVRVLSADPQAVIRAQELLRRQLTNPNLTNQDDYLATAQQLYQWLIAPIERELAAAGITNLSFIMDAGLRTLPLAALHDGQQFLVEKYSLGLIPSLGLIDPTYVDLNRQNSSLLVGGASQFVNQPPLLAARTEMETLQAFWPSTRIAEADFTVRSMQRARGQAQIIHLATHAQFLRGAPDQSYIQFFDGRLRLNQMAELGWFEPTVDLVTLSACQTAMGNLEAELGFAGFALQAGARSALASLWRVSDEATTGLMASFYQQLDQQSTKVEALRQAQLAMVRGEAYIDSGTLIWPGGSIPLPPELVVSGRQDLSHPFYWAAFTMVGSPW